MRKFRRHDYPHLYLKLSRVFLFSIVLVSTGLFAQQREIQKDSLKINDGISGIATYQYNTSNGKEVYDGKFSFQSLSEARSEEFDFLAITYQGEYASNRKSGDWIYSNKKMKQIDQRFVSDLRVGTLANGTENRISGRFQDGKAVGEWQVIKQDFIKSEIEDTLFLIESTFKNNQLIGSFKSTSDSIAVQGYFNADGYFHGSWEIDHKKEDKSVREIRSFKAGVLQTYKVIIDENTFTISYSGLDTSKSDEEEVWEDISLYDGYFDILSLVELSIEQTVSSSVHLSIDNYHNQSNKFIENSVLALSKNSGVDVWNSLKGSEPIELGKFKVRKFQFTKDEQEKIVEIKNNFERIKSILNKFSENPKVKIGKPVYEKFNEAELIFNIYKNELNQLERLVSVISSDAFEYVDRTKIYDKIWPKLRFPEEVIYEFQSELVTQSHDFPETSERQNFDLVQATSLIQNILQDVENLDSEVNRILRAMQTEKSLSSNEEKLIKKREKIEKLFDENLEGTALNKLQTKYAELILQLTEETFNAYGNLDVEDKKNEIQSVLDCYDSLIQFHAFLEALSSKDERLDDAYMKSTFNAYMMVDMTERIKENIYDAFENTLKPYMFDKLRNNFSCESVRLAMDDIDGVYQKMLDLSKRDTKQEEKELRREKDPKAILSVLGLELKY